MISVIIATKNEERYLRRCLLSLDRQREFVEEIIVADGGSTDGTLDIAEEYADIVISDVKLDTPGKARNEGASRAKGSILAFVDADTIVGSSWGKSIVKCFSSEEVVGATGPILPMEGDSSLLMKASYLFSYNFLVRATGFLRIPHFLGLNCAYRRGVFRLLGGFPNKKISEDVLFSMKVGRYGKMIFCPGMLSYTSSRRIRKQGIGWALTYLVYNSLKVLLTGEPMEFYPKV